MPGREPYLGCAIGKRGIGKTTTTLKMIGDYVKGNPHTGAPPRKVLILDANNEFNQIKRLALEDVGKFSKQKKIQARRVSIFKSDGSKMTLDELCDSLMYILDHYYNGMLLVEDPTKYISDSLPQDLVGAICTQRHVGVDIIMHFQFFGKIAHPKIWPNMNWVRWHKVGDSVKRHKNKLQGANLEPLHIMENLVNMKYREEDRYFYAYLDNDYDKIKGRFSKNDFTEAIKDYLRKNYNSTVKAEMDKRDLMTGERLYSDQKQVVNSLIDRLFSDYYGNPK